MSQIGRNMSSLDSLNAGQSSGIFKDKLKLGQIEMIKLQETPRDYIEIGSSSRRNFNQITVEKYELNREKSNFSRNMKQSVA